MGCETPRVHQIPPGRSGPTPPERRDAVQFRGGIPRLRSKDDDTSPKRGYAGSCPTGGTRLAGSMPVEFPVAIGGTRGTLTLAAHCWCGPGSFTPGLGFDPRREHVPWKVRSARRRHRSRKPGGARASGFDSCTFRNWKTISRWRERRLLNGWTLTGCGSTPPASAQSIEFRTLHRSEPTRPAGSPGTSLNRWP